MDRYALQEVGTSYDRQAIDAELRKIEGAIQLLYSRVGDHANSMHDDVDADNNSVLDLKSSVVQASAIRLDDSGWWGDKGVTGGPGATGPAGATGWTPSTPAVGNFLANSSGVVSISGLGFQPRVLIMFGVVVSGAATTSTFSFTGEDEVSYGIYRTSNTGGDKSGIHSSLGFFELTLAASPAQQTDLISLDSDGFTYNVVIATVATEYRYFAYG